MSFELLLVGVVLAVLYVEILEIYPGGIVVPGFVALHLDSPGRIVTTVVIALLALLTYRVMSGYLILFGKRRFALLVLLGALGAQLSSLVLTETVSTPTEIQAVGWVVPGLLANNLEKQKLVPTLASMMTVAIATYFLVKTLSWF